MRRKEVNNLVLIYLNITLTVLILVLYSSLSLPVSESVGIQIGTDQEIWSTLSELTARICSDEGVEQLLTEETGYDRTVSR